jgi:hypothetical protein
MVIPSGRNGSGLTGKFAIVEIQEAEATQSTEEEYCTVDGEGVVTPTNMVH